MLTAAILVIVFIPMLLEARRAAANERAQLARGGIEAPHDVYGVMRVAYPAAFLAMIAEGWIRGLPAQSLVLTGAAIFAASKALKWWAIASLGSFWTFRVITIPSSTLVSTGPYSFLRHPNYVGVIGELAGTALMAGAFLTGPIATLGFGLLIVKRISVEEHALHTVNTRS